uniref:Uncharacterized protein n=1 Tax=Janibacter limosus TaxID=53458 RepID=A0AC61U3S7_9MICO|nr:hypothetical protein [Janibacter limosus]
MTPAYRRQLATLRATADRGGSGDLVSIGDRVRVLTPGRYRGFVGVVVKQGPYPLPRARLGVPAHRPLRPRGGGLG